MAITDRTVVGGTDRLLPAIREAVAGGLPALMLRERHELPEEELLSLVRQIRTITRDAGTLLIVNRHLELARTALADGVHLGAEGPTLREARRELGPSAILGYSAHSPREALRALEEGAHYVMFSPVFDTPSKRGILKPVGLAALTQLARDAPGPVIALGGIDGSNLAEVAATGAAGIAVIRAIFAATSPRSATAQLLARWDESVQDLAGKETRP